MMSLRVAAAVALPALLAACSLAEGPDSIDPPSLMLDPPAPRVESNLPRGDYTVTNGSGEVLLEAEDVAPEQKHEARFEEEKLDGAITVTVTRDGQTVYTQTLEHPPGEPVRLVWDIELARFLLDEPQSAASGSMAGDGGGGGKD